MKFDTNPKNIRKLRNYQYKLLICIKKGIYSKQIARQLNEPNTTIHDRLNRLIDIGLIKKDVKSSCTLYKITRLGYICLSSHRSELSRYLRGRGKTRMHRLNIKFRIIDNNIKAKFEKNYKLNNWIQRYTTVKFPIGITIKKTPKSVIAMFHEFETKKSSSLTDFFQHIMKGINYVYYFLIKEYKIKIDIFSGIITDQHIVNEMPELDKKLDKKVTTVMDLARVSKSIFPTEISAKAWIDRSQGMPEVETNDFLYEEKLLMMPEYTEKIAHTFIPTMEELTKQIYLHLQVQKDTQKIQKKTNINIEHFGNGVSRLVKVIQKLEKAVKKLER